MIFLPYIHFFCFLVYGYLACYVIYKGPKQLLNKTCSVLMLCFSIWHFNDFFTLTPGITKDTAVLLQNISSFGWIGFPCALLCFSLAFNKKKRSLRKKIIILSIIILPLIFIYLQWTNYLTINIEQQSYGWSYNWTNTIWPYLFYVYYISCTLLSILYIYRYGKMTEKLYEKKQAKIIIISIFVSLIGGTAFDVIIPLLNIKSIPPLANIFILIFAVGLVYAIVKYRFLTLTSAIAAENIISTMKEFLVLLDQEGKILTVNKAILDSLKYDQKELERKSIETLFKKDNFNNSLLEKITKGDIVRNYDTFLQTKNGEIIPVLFSSSPLKNEEGNIVGIVFIAEDITEHKLAEELLVQEQYLTHALMENVPDHIYFKDINSRFIKINNAQAQFFGLSDPSLAIGKTDFDFFTEEHASQAYADEQKIIQTGQALIKEEKETRDKFPDSWVSTTKMPLYDKGGKIIGTYGISKDITERKHAEEKIKNSLNEKEVLLRELYHRTKNNMQLIHSIIGLKSLYTQSTEVKQTFKEIGDKIQSMSLVHQMLYQSNDLSQIDIKAYITALIRYLVLSYREVKERIIINLQVETFQVLIDTAIPLGLIINELISNAFKYAFPGNNKGEINVCLIKNIENIIELKFSDNGIGVREDFQFREQNSLGMKTIFLIGEKQLNGNVKFETGNGLKCIITFSDTLYKKRV